jgi:predicted Zn-dependent peptidase
MTAYKTRKKSGKQENVIFIDLPKRTSKVFISVVFQLGFYNELKETYGLTHLLEHFITDFIQKALDSAFINGSIDNTYTRFDLDTSKREVVNHFSTILKIISQPQFHDEKLLSKEKARIKIEFYEQYSDFRQWLMAEIINFLINSPVSFKRKRIKQIKNVEKASLQDLKRVHRLLMNYPYNIFISGYKLVPTQKRVLSGIAQEFFKNQRYGRSKFTKAVYSMKRSQTICNPTVYPKYVHYSLIFPTFSLQDSSISERMALGFICIELERLFTQSMGEMGVYKTDYKYAITENYGFVTFFSYVSKESKDECQKIIFKDTERLLERKDLNKKLQKYIMEKKKDLKKLWNGNGTRTDWIIDDIIDFGSVKPLSEVQRELNGVTLEKVEVVARRIFNPANLRILIAISNKKLSKIESL